ncbi:MAG: AAA family ATPase [Planctomycetes bacterium]|nr:AAA family ATPase [Planctomycetota bacterium]
MARLSVDRDFSPILNAAKSWIDRCLIGDGSIFSEQSLWTPANIEELRKAFVEMPDEGEGSFDEKFQRQLKHVSPAAQQLAAEMLWAAKLFPSNLKASTKLRPIRETWELSGLPFPANHPLVTEEVLRGIGSGGQGYNNNFWLEMRFLINLMAEFKNKFPSNRQSVIGDYDRLTNLIDRVRREENRQFRHMLRYFALPDRVERMCSTGEKWRALEGFGAAPGSNDDKSLDDALFNLRQKLQSEYPSQVLDFYGPPLRQRWIVDKEESEPAGKSASPSTQPAAAATPETPATRRYDLNHVIEELFVDDSVLYAIAGGLKRKKNVILQGPPGVGKSFAARRLAYAHLGVQDPSRVQAVQFHPSYAYEDFVQGYRPTNDGRFALQDGVFHRFCRKATAEPTRQYVFIIDEINRGNVSKIFGELMLLIEPDKRGADHAIPLTYSVDGEAFFVPENLCLIGLMNTADRSLAMIDYALRRRFLFFTLEPSFTSARFRQHLESRGAEPDLVKRIVERMTTLNRTIAADTRSLGHGYQIGHSYFCAMPGENLEDNPLDQFWFKDVVQHEIKPLLEEYWFDRPEEVRDQVARLMA